MSCRHGSSAAAEMSLSRDEQRGTAPLLPNVPEMQTEAHRSCTHGVPCPHWHWVPADSGQVSHPALATGLHMVRMSKVALHPPGTVPQPLLAQWSRPHQLPGPVMSSASDCSTKLLYSAQVMPVTLCLSPRLDVGRDPAFWVSQDKSAGSPSAGSRTGLCWADARLPCWLRLHGSAGGGGSRGEPCC